jgi:hypothetical protein
MTYNDAKALEGLLARYLRGIDLLRSTSRVDARLNTLVNESYSAAERAIILLRFGMEVRQIEDLDRLHSSKPVKVAG